MCRMCNNHVRIRVYSVSDVEMKKICGKSEQEPEKIPGAGSVTYFHGPQSFEKLYGSNVNFKKIVVMLQ
jgi:hypothetical protein